MEEAEMNGMSLYVATGQGVHGAQNHTEKGTMKWIRETEDDPS